MQTENFPFDEVVKQCARLKAAHATMPKDTPEEEGVFYAWVDALEAAVSCPVSTAGDLLAKLDIYDQFRAQSSVYVDNAEDLVKQQIAALVTEFRRVLSASESAGAAAVKPSSMDDGALETALIDLGALMEGWSLIGGGGAHPDLDGYFYARAAEHVAEARSAFYGECGDAERTAEDSTFADTLANFRKAKNLADRQPHGTEEQGAAYKAAEEAFAAMIGCYASTPAELQAKMDAFAVWRLEYDIDGEKGEQIASIFSDVRRVTGEG